jgi:dTDP-4-dehydrorhamnose reductase
VFLLLAGGYRAALPGIFTRYHVLYYFLGKEKHFLRIAIVGAQGMLGSDLIAHIPSGHQVIGTDIDDFDITNQEETLQALLQIKPAWVINVAAYTQVDRCEEDSEQAFQVNAAGVKNLALACKEIRAKLFHVSTDYVFDGKTKKPYREEDALNPLPFLFMDNPSVKENLLFEKF